MAKIFTLSEASSIALHGMVLIGQTEETLNVAKISEAIGASKHHVAKVFQRLVKDNLLSSTRGPSGGFRLKKSPKKISLLDIYESIEGTLEVHACASGNTECPFKSCIMGDLSHKLTGEFRSYLKTATLDTYIK